MEWEELSGLCEENGADTIELNYYPAQCRIKKVRDIVGAGLSSVSDLPILNDQ